MNTLAPSYHCKECATWHQETKQQGYLFDYGSGFKIYSPEHYAKLFPLWQNPIYSKQNQLGHIYALYLVKLFLYMAIFWTAGPLTLGRNILLILLLITIVLVNYAEGQNEKN